MPKAKKAFTFNTSVTFLLDKSGSMSADKKGTIEAFNTYLDGLRIPGPDNIEFSLILFDTISTDKLAVRQAPAAVPNLTDATYTPAGGTPLIDAACKTIKAVEASVRADQKVVIVFQTDGEENASREFSWEQLNDMIKEKTALGWQFIFMGAGIDAYQQGSRMGISALNTMSYDPTDQKMHIAAFASTARNTRGYSMGLSASAAYDDLDKQDAGDRYAKSSTAPIPPKGPPTPASGSYSSAPSPWRTPAVKKPAIPNAGKKSIVDDFTL